ncbi:MAG: NAD(P)/FAD-dependent oxidoreductase [Candidatus Hydrogenedentota bacterium]|nr:MAG: NAD(P)/FAD-dependent oxidoreductase [Candidatus Hydrogenedentota bacterium]
MYDVIIIGSGAGSLTTAALLAKLEKKKVLLLERHFKAGGFTHIFKRKQKYLWDVGVHYIGDLQEGGLLRQIFDFLTDKKLKWKKMPSVFEKFVYPDFTFAVKDNPDEYKQDLINMFPEEKEAIENYFSDIKQFSQWFARHITLKGKPAFFNEVKSHPANPRISNPLMSTADYMEANFQDKKLQALLCSQWGDYGLPPKQSAFAIHATVVNHYLRGGYYPVGSSSQIAANILPAIQEAGGDILLNKEVQEIIVENGKAIGVRGLDVRKQEPFEFYANSIVSGAGAYRTYVQFLKGQLQEEAKAVQTFYNNYPVTTNITIYLGLNRNPVELGFYGENHWIYSSYNHEENFEKRTQFLQTGEIGGAYLSFPSLKDEHTEAEGHTAEIIAFTDYAPFAKYANLPWKKRGEEYEALKQKIAKAFLDYIEKHYPGFQNMVDYLEVSTPVTNEFFSNHPLGSIYGIPSVPGRYHSKEAGFTVPKTRIENLYLTGVDVSSPGVAGAVMGGISAFIAMHPKWSLLKILKQT